jgi:hypothetical protein
MYSGRQMTLIFENAMSIYLFFSNPYQNNKQQVGIGKNIFVDCIAQVSLLVIKIKFAIPF